MAPEISSTWYVTIILFNVLGLWLKFAGNSGIISRLSAYTPLPLLVATIPHFKETGGYRLVGGQWEIATVLTVVWLITGGIAFLYVDGRFTIRTVVGLIDGSDSDSTSRHPLRSSGGNADESDSLLMRVVPTPDRVEVPVPDE